MTYFISRPMYSWRSESSLFVFEVAQSFVIHFKVLLQSGILYLKIPTEMSRVPPLKWQVINCVQKYCSTKYIRIHPLLHTTYMSVCVKCWWQNEWRFGSSHNFNLNNMFNSLHHLVSQHLNLQLDVSLETPTHPLPDKE